MPKYEYLTKKDLNYKQNAFEQAKFAYSPLGKVFTDGLDKSDKNEGLLKRLKNIEDKSNNQLLAFKDINTPAIKGRNGNGNGNDIDDGILNKTNIEELDNIINKWIQTKDILHINNEIKLVQENLIYITFFIRI